VFNDQSSKISTHFGMHMIVFHYSHATTNHQLVDFLTTYSLMQ